MNADEIYQKNDYTEEIFSTNAIISALEILDDPQQLGRHPLTQLKIVEFRRKSAGYSNRSLGKGIALKEILVEGIDRLKPNEQEPDYFAINWRHFGVLSERYVKKRKVKAIADTFGIGSRQFYRDRKAAVNSLSKTILEWEEVPFTARAKPEFKAPFTVPTNPNYELIGRNDFLQKIQDKLLHGENKSIALYGLPGVGKTAIAAELAYQTQVREYFDGGILWAGLGQSPNPRVIMSDWALKLGYTQDEISKYSRKRDLTELIRDAVGSRKVLVIIDDAWDITSAVAFRIGCDSCVYLLTTRQPSIAADFAESEDFRVNELDIDQGVDLIKSMVPVVRGSRSLAEELITLVGGLPLAIQLMGRFLRIESIEKQPRRINDAIKKLRDTEKRLQLELPQILPDYHPVLPEGASISLDSVIAVSIDALDDLSQQAIFALSVFPPKPNSFSESAAKMIAQISEETLDAIYDWGLLEISGIGRYTMHQTITDYASLRLDNHQVYHLLVAYCANFTSTHQDKYGKIDIEIKNLEFGLSCAFKNEMYGNYLEITTNLYSYYVVRGLYDTAEVNATNAKIAADKINDDTGLTTALIHLGRISINKADYEKAENYLTEGMKIAKELGEQSLVCDITQSLGLVRDHLGELLNAKKLYQESLSITSKLDDHRRTIQLFLVLGAISIDLNELDEAEQYLQNGLDLSLRSNNRDFFSPLKMNLGIVAAYRGNLDLEESNYLEALDVAYEIGYREDICFLYMNLGANLNGRGNHKKAKEYFQEALKIANEIGNRERISSALKNIGGAERRLGEYLAAEDHLSDALSIASKINQQRNICATLIELGILHTNQDHLDKADLYLSEGVGIAKKLENTWHICEGMIWYGNLKLKQGDVVSGQTYLTNALELAQGELEELAAEAIFGLAKAALLDDKDAEAKEYALESLNKFTEIKHYRWRTVSQWLRDQIPDFEE